jgi:hypothetical protein
MCTADRSANTTSTRRDTQMGGPPLRLRGTRDDGSLGVPARAGGWVPVAPGILVVPLPLCAQRSILISPAVRAASRRAVAAFNRSTPSSSATVSPWWKRRSRSAPSQFNATPRIRLHYLPMNRPPGPPALVTCQVPTAVYSSKTTGRRVASLRPLLWCRLVVNPARQHPVGRVLLCALRAGAEPSSHRSRL